MDNKLRNFIIKKSVIASAIIWVLGFHFKEFSSQLIDILIQPFFSIDLDQNSVPDLKQLGQYKLVIAGSVFPIGRLLYFLIKFVFEILIIYWLVSFILSYTHLVKL